MEIKEFHKIVVEHKNCPTIPTETYNIPLLEEGDVFAIKIDGEDFYRTYYILAGGEVVQNDIAYKLKPTK